jgi:SMI1 / KNR4 family (SUKH-1)
LHKTIINPSPELYELYSWKNGTKWESGTYLGHLALFPGARLMPIEQAIEAYKVRSGKDEYWLDTLFPIFDFGGAFYLLDFDDQSSNYQQIFYYCLNETDFEVIVSIYDNLKCCFDTIIQCYKAKAFLLIVNLLLNQTSS